MDHTSGAERCRPPAPQRRSWSADQGAEGQSRRQDRRARTHLDAASAELDRVADAVTAEMQSHIRARLANLRALDEQMGLAWDAGSAITEALAQHRPPRPAS